ncbi:hypothetical protein H8E77_08135 [bacterium]|nr:hypothetical protein [bacterium]
MNTNLFLIDLYNIHLPDEPLREVKQNLTKTIWKHHKLLGVQVIGDKLEKKEMSIPWADKVPGLGMTIADERNFEIKPDYLGYQSSDVDWWLSDYPSLLEEYNRLRSFVDDYIEGKFNTKNHVWLNEALTRFPYGLTINFDSRFQISLVEFVEACYNGEKSDKIMEIDINRVNIGFCFNHSKMTANEVILAPAYIEIIDLLRTKPLIERCIAYKTPRKDACQNIFIAQRKKGPTQQFCSATCRRRIHKHEKKHHKDKIKRLNRGMVDAKRAK